MADIITLPVIRVERQEDDPTEEVVEAVARALCRELYSDNTNDVEPQVNAFWTEEIGAARAAIEAYRRAMQEIAK